MARWYILILAALLLQGSNFYADDHKLSKTLVTALNATADKEMIPVWIEFADKGESRGNSLLPAAAYVSAVSMERRLKCGVSADYSDIPVYSNYVAVLDNMGVKAKQRSRWLNRISAMMTKEQIKEVSSMDFVKRLDVVGRFSLNREYPETPEGGISPEVPAGAAESLNYGSSLAQMQIINAVVTHDSGFFGQGVKIALFDAGVDNLEHPCFDSIRARGLRTYDFVNNDTIVDDQSGQEGQGWHGTMTLSLVGGYKPGNLISPAFRSSYIIAKTENTDSETPLEEDNWIAAAEWADSLGADIITSSLGYIGMDIGSSRSYDWTWMNGDSCVITIGADLAVNKGIVVCNSAGNEGSHSTRNTLAAPSDGDSVIAVGSVTSTGTRSSFSSVGLSVDGRIKPDIMARGSGNYIAQTGSGSGYSTGSGTSFSCPMTAGVVAQMLSANKTLTPIQVREILKQTASRASNPDRFMGWGIINSWEAVKVAKATVNTRTLNLKLFIEGLYNTQSSTMISDTVKVFLRNTVSPFLKIDSSKAMLSSSGQGTFSFTKATGDSYYLQISHRSGIETWSKTPQSFSLNSMTFDFTDSRLKAYGDNLKQAGSKWVVFTGDADQDGNIDIADLTMTDNDASAFVSGYLPTDFNGDSFVDILDLGICDNNVTAFVGVIKP